jgi:hypothetical protein
MSYAKLYETNQKRKGKEKEKKRIKINRKRPRGPIRPSLKISLGPSRNKTRKGILSLPQPLTP